MTLAERRWRKASLSANEGNCVELAGTLDRVRDSKNTAGPVLRGDLSSLVAAVKGGQFSR
jgi:hypothetical protein